MKFAKGGRGVFSPRPRGRGKGEGLLALSFPPSNNPALSEHNPRLLEENRPLIPLYYQHVNLEQSPDR